MEFHEIVRELMGFAFLREMSPPKSLIFDKECLCFRAPGAGMFFLQPKHQDLVKFSGIQGITMEFINFHKILWFYGQKQVFAPGHENLNDPLGIS